MKSFLKTFLASWFGSCFGVLAVAALPLLIFAALAASLASGAGSWKFGGGDGKKPLLPNTFLVVDVSRGFTDHPTFSARNRGGSLLPREGGAYGLLDSLTALARAAEDERIRGVLLTGSDCAAGAATLFELQRALVAFRRSGKPVYAYLPSPTTSDYFLAAAADEIWTHPLAEIPLNGLASGGIYFRSALEKLGVGVQIVKVGTFKSAVEPLISDSMSAADREQRARLVENRWNALLASLSLLRKVPAEKLAAGADAVGLYDVPAARELGLSDAAKYADEVIAALREKGAPDDELNSFRQIDLCDYMRRCGVSVVPEVNMSANDDAGDHVAVIYAEGEIVDGYGTPDEVGGERLAALIREIRANDSVRAAVLRVNSPGGSVFASEQIRRELELLAREVPLVVSMGDVAASGGYWISAPAKKIFAGPTTVTGSIGVFGVIPNFEDLGKKIGVSTESVVTSKLAELGTARRPHTPQELAVFQSSVDKTYERFVSLVAESRGLPRERVKEIAEGRVWDGVTAHELKLADEIGGLADAIAAAKELAGDAELEVRQYPGNVNPLQDLADLLSSAEDDGGAPFASALAAFAARGRDASPAGTLSREFAAAWKHLRALNDPNCLYARLPWDFREDARR
ncbi:MAG: signal peptide peptidase SppA [Candidatus Spyradosoma sp.]